MDSILEIKPGVGLSRLIFGASMKEAESLFGAAEEIEVLDDIEDAISTVLIKHFPHNALGQDIWPDIYRLKNDIENYNPEEPETWEIS